MENGTRIFNHGDMANPECWGTVVEDLGNAIRVAIDDSDKVHTIPKYMISKEYKGNGLTRIVTKSAYDAWKSEQVAMFFARFPHLAHS